MLDQWVVVGRLISPKCLKQCVLSFTYPVCCAGCEFGWAGQRAGGPVPGCMLPAAFTALR